MAFSGTGPPRSPRGGLEGAVKTTAGKPDRIIGTPFSLFFLSGYVEPGTLSVKFAVVVGFARTDDGHNHRQGATFARAAL